MGYVTKKSQFLNLRDETMSHASGGLSSNLSVEIFFSRYYYLNRYEKFMRMNWMGRVCRLINDQRHFRIT